MEFDMKCLKFATLSAAALLLLAPSVKAQCPAGATPLSVLVGGWSYKAEFVSSQPFPPVFSYVAAGTFTASIGTDRSGNPVGLLRSVQSSQLNGNPIRFESDYGASTYVGFPNCGGVTLVFKFSTKPVTYDCWFQAGRSILYCVSATDEFPAVLHASRVEVALTPGL
ncbi:MAG TPA: hypothetical protein VKX45_01215 [Bryobacteraceae bacterium]|nr:hypothetical protein [Bryobacteraceae bacterium]